MIVLSHIEAGNAMVYVKMISLLSGRYWGMMVKLSFYAGEVHGTQVGSATKKLNQYSTRLI